MKTFISRAKNLTQKAAELKAAMQQLPPKVAEVREAVASTTGQLQQLRTEIQSSLAGLKADNENRLSQALQEINASLGVFLEAGYELAGVDLEISPSQRLIVRLNKLEDVHPSVIRSLIAANQPRATTHALLTALLQARLMTDKVELVPLRYRELVVHVGAIPTVRLCWRPDEVFEAAEVPQAGEAAPPAAPVPAAAFGQGAFFERRPAQPSPPTAAESAKPLPTPAPTPKPAPTVPRSSYTIRQPVVLHAEDEAAASAWKQDALERFKKMPDLSKYKR